MTSRWRQRSADAWLARDPEQAHLRAQTLEQTTLDCNCLYFYPLTVMSLGNLLDPSDPQFPRLKSEAGLLPGMEIFAPECTGNLLEASKSQVNAESPDSPTVRPAPPAKCLVSPSPSIWNILPSEIQSRWEN